MVEILWHRRETRRQTENTNIAQKPRDTFLLAQGLRHTLVLVSTSVASYNQLRSATLFVPSGTVSWCQPLGVIVCLQPKQIVNLAVERYVNLPPIRPVASAASANASRLRHHSLCSPTIRSRPWTEASSARPPFSGLHAGAETATGSRARRATCGCAP